MIHHRLRYVTVGGTFDRLHRGHRTLISRAVAIADKVLIALTVDRFSTHKQFSEVIRPYADRHQELTMFLRAQGWSDRCKIIPLADKFGPAITDAALDGIVVTAETAPTARLINERRKGKGLAPLALIEIPLIKGEDHRIIRSSRIREGAIDREGLVFARMFADRRAKSLPESLRHEMRQPIGTVIAGDETNLDLAARKVVTMISRLKPPLVISVGDIVTSSLKAVGYTGDIVIVDYRNRRHELSAPARSHQPKVKNRAGTIMHEAVNRLRHSLYESGKRTIVVSGEEDLLALPAILMAPLGSIIVYGQAGLGIIAVEVTEERKQQVRDMLQKFTWAPRSA